MKLIPHPDWRAEALDSIEVDGDIRRGVTALTYRMRGEMPAMLEPAAPERTDGLWRDTCFELFVKPAGGEGYFEFNFAPSGQWAAYRFDGYRAGMADLAVATPVIERLDNGVRVTVDLGGLPEGDWRVGVSAVIVEADGTRSFWALAHPPGKPDFHDRAGFVLTA